MFPAVQKLSLTVVSESDRRDTLAKWAPLIVWPPFFMKTALTKHYDSWNVNTPTQSATALIPNLDFTPEILSQTNYFMARNSARIACVFLFWFRADARVLDPDSPFCTTYTTGRKMQLPIEKLWSHPQSFKFEYSTSLWVSVYFSTSSLCTHLEISFLKEGVGRN